MPTFAAVDIGSNSVRLKISRLTAHRLVEIHDDREVTRLGESVFRSGFLSPEAIALTVKVLRRFHRDCQRYGADSVRVVAKGPTVLIAGHKRPRRTRAESSFHLVERGYGRFARAVQVSAACDTSRARATLSNGELRISIPRLVERRGRVISIAIDADKPVA